MKRLLLSLGVAIVPFVLVACNGGGGGGGGAGSDAAADDSPEAQAVRYRQGIMRSIEWKVRELRAMADGETALDEAQFKESTRELASLATMIPEGFGPGTDKGASLAQPAVWTNRDDFLAKARDFAALTEQFATSANQNGFEASKAMAAQVGGACRNCHSPYRRRE